MKQLLVTIFLIFPVYLQASDDFYIQAGIGFGSLDVEPEYQINSNNEGNSTFGLQAVIGRRFSNNVSIDMGVMSHTAWNFFGMPVTDESDLYEGLVQLGYVFNSEKEIQIIPKIGYSYWELHSTEGMFLNPGPEAKSKLYGSDLNYSVMAKFNKLYVSYKRADYEFGPVNSILFGFGLSL